MYNHSTSQSFNIKQQSGHRCFSSALLYDVFDSNSTQTHSIEVTYTGWKHTRNVVIKDHHARVLTSINPIKKSRNWRLKRSMGDDGCVYDREVHNWKNDIYTLERHLDGRLEHFVFNRFKRSSYSGSIQRISNSQDIASIQKESHWFSRDEYNLNTDHTIPIENLLAFLGLLIAIKKEKENSAASSSAASSSASAAASASFGGC